MSAKSLLVSVVVGAGAAVATTAIMEWARPAPEQAFVANASTAVERVTREVVFKADRDSLNRITALEAALEDVRFERGEAAMQESEELGLPQDPEQEQASTEAYFADREAHYREDPSDPSWSATASTALRDGLSAMGADLGFTVDEAECRTEVCRATVRWEDFELAQADGAHLAHNTIPGLNCAQSVWLREPDDRSAEYSADLYLDCSGLRAGAVD